MRPDEIQVLPALDYASGTADLDGTTIDTQGFDWVVFVAHIHAVAGAATVVNIEQGDASNLSDAAVAEGASRTLADDDDGEIVAIAIEKPIARYLRIMLDKDGSNAVGASGVAILGRGRTQPALQAVAGESEVIKLVSPADS